MSQLSELDLLLANSPLNDWLSDSSGGLDSLFEDPNQGLWDFSYDIPHIPPPPAVPKNNEPLAANQSQLESSSDLKTHTIPVPVLNRTLTLPNNAGGTSLNLPPTATVAQPIHEPPVQLPPAPLKRKRQSEETKDEGRLEKKKRGKRSTTGSTDEGSSVPSNERSVKRRKKHSAYYAGLDSLLDQASNISMAGSHATADGNSLASPIKPEETTTGFELTVKQ